VSKEAGKGGEGKELKDQLAALQQQLAAREQQLAATEQQLAEADAKERFRTSLANIHKGLYYEITNVRKLSSISAQMLEKNRAFVSSLPADLKPQERATRNVFHTCAEDVIRHIEEGGMKPVECPFCCGDPGTRWMDHDNGFFGNHSKGIYVSKHADYTFYYQRHCVPRPGDVGVVLMLELVTGRVKHFDQMDMGVQPSPAHHCHESPKHLEYYVYDDNTVQNPPAPCYRVVPKWAISWCAVENTRVGVVHDQ
jgi:hypothetical protein